MRAFIAQRIPPPAVPRAVSDRAPKPIPTQRLPENLLQMLLTSPPCPLSSLCDSSPKGGARGGVFDRPFEGHTLRDRISSGRAPQTNASTQFASFSCFPEHQFQNGSRGCIFIGAKPAWEAQRERDAPVFAKQLRSHFHGKTSELFLFFLGKSGAGRRGANTGISQGIQMLGFQRLS